MRINNGVYFEFNGGTSPELRHDGTFSCWTVETIGKAMVVVRDGWFSRGVWWIHVIYLVYLKYTQILTCVSK